MKKNKYLLSFILTFFTFNLNSKPWTYLTYIAGDNNLAGMINQDLNEMIKGANNNVDVLAFVNVKQNGQKVTKKYNLTNNGAILVDEEFNLDSGIPSTLVKALNWSFTLAPSNYILLDLWNHGSGVLNPARKRGVCFDDSTGNYLNDIDLKQALDQVVQARGKKIDILAFDACLMAMIECNVTWADDVNYIVASQELVDAKGFNYDLSLKYLAQNPNDPRSFASYLVTAFKQTYQNVSTDFTLSAIDASKIKLLAQNVNQTAQILMNFLGKNENKRIQNLIMQSRNTSQTFDESSYIDLADFYQNLSKSLANLNIKPIIVKNLNQSINDGLALIKQCVINNAVSQKNSNANGISIYFPKKYIDQSYAKLYWSQQYPNWLNFLRKILN